MNVKIEYSIKKPFTAQIEKVSPLNKEGSTKSNYHVEISIEGSAIAYEVGSSFGLLPFNHEGEIEQLLATLGVDKTQMVHPKKVENEISIHDFFLQHVNISRLTQKIANACLPYQANNKLETLLKQDWKGYCDHHDLLEFLVEFYCKKMPVEELVKILILKAIRQKSGIVFLTRLVIGL